MCGIVGILAKSEVNQRIYDALTMIQHRGQDAAGIMTSDGKRVYLRKSNGLVRDAIHGQHMLQLKGHMGIGHVRYPTAGTESAAEAQPLYVNSPYGLAIAHNGNLINAQKLKTEIFKSDHRHLNTDSDSEVLLNVFAHELQQQAKAQLTPENIFAAVSQLHRRVKGAYATIIMIVGHGILGFRDPFGIRPMCYGKYETAEGNEYMMASESVAIDALNFELMGDILPGEAVFIDLDGNIHRHQCAENWQYSPCIFEYVYLARPDSLIDKISVYKMRLMMGKLLAKKILQLHPNHDIDVVIPIPETSRTAAMPLARCLGVKYREGFVKNRYIGRTFIMPGQKQRKKSVNQKLNPIPLEFQGKNILLVDDSIVRGTTSQEIIQMARAAGANKVYFASTAPEVSYPNVYGIDMPAASELIAHNRTNKEIADLIGADWLVFQDLRALYDCAHAGNPHIKRFEDSIFTGDYITGGVSEKYLQLLEQKRQDAARYSAHTINDEDQMIEIYNS